MTKPKVFISRPLPASAYERIAAQCDVTMHSEDARMSLPELVAACREVEGLIASGTPVGREVIEQARRLRVVCTVGVGFDSIDVETCTRRGVMVTNTPGVVTEATADLSFALLMAVARRIVEADRFVREGHWKHWEFGCMWGTDLVGKTIGIYGFGRIGQAVARRARGFNMRIIYHDLARRAPQEEKELSAQFVDRDTLLREADFLSVHVPLAPDTHHMIGAAHLALMKPSAFLINTSRGKVVEEAALVEALESRRIAGAGLDVFEFEPQINAALLKMPNVVMSPHMGTATAETRLAMAMRAADNLLAALSGERPPYLVNPEVWGRVSSPGVMRS